MASTTLESGFEQPVSPVGRLWRRQLARYPEAGSRYSYLGIVVVATIILYYEFYVQGSVAPSILRDFDMSFTYYVYIQAVGNLIGAFASLVAGLADRWGRANLVAYGLGFTAAITAFGLPNAPDKLTYAVLFAGLAFVEGIILVATPALVRDFSPQVGRASAMGFWTLGPVLGSLFVSAVSSNTLDSHPNWRLQFYICGAVGFVAFTVALFGLRELSPPLRDQLMVTMRDRALVEARAKGLDVEKALEKPWRQMLRPDIVGSAFAISVLLLIYYILVGFIVVYFTTVFNRTQQDANGIGNWLWGFDAIALVLIGLMSDRLRVRKPFMLVGAVGAITMTVIFLRLADHPNTGYYHIVLVVSLLAIFLGLAYAPWLASFTETVEKHNPALTATGLAVWGWIIRVVVAASAFFAPVIVNATTPLVDYGPEVQAAAARVGQPLLSTVRANQALFDELAKFPDASKIPAPLLRQGIAKVGAPTLLAAQKHKADLTFLSAHGQDVLNAQKKSPRQWQHYFWICAGGQAVFIPLIFVMAGAWSPRTARRREEEHEAAVMAELANLVAVAAGVVGGTPAAAPAPAQAPAESEPSSVTVIPAQPAAPAADPESPENGPESPTADS